MKTTTCQISSISELQKFVSEPNSSVFVEYHKQVIQLQPFHLADLKHSVKSYFDEWINKYRSSFHGIVVGYRNIKVFQPLASLLGDHSGITINVAADFFIFRPKLGNILKGVVTHKSPSHMTCLVYKTFVATLVRTSNNIEDSTEEEMSEWLLPKQIQIGTEVTFTITQLDLKLKIPYIQGKIIDESLPSCVSPIDDLHGNLSESADSGVGEMNVTNKKKHNKSLIDVVDGNKQNVDVLVGKRKTQSTNDEFLLPKKMKNRGTDSQEFSSPKPAKKEETHNTKSLSQNEPSSSTQHDEHFKSMTQILKSPNKNEKNSEASPSQSEGLSPRKRKKLEETNVLKQEISNEIEAEIIPATPKKNEGRERLSFEIDTSSSSDEMELLSMTQIIASLNSQEEKSQNEVKTSPVKKKRKFGQHSESEEVPEFKTPIVTSPKITISESHAELPSVNTSEDGHSSASESRKKKKDKDRENISTGGVMDVTPFRKPADLESIRSQRIMSDVQESDSSSCSSKKKKKDKRNSVNANEVKRTQGESTVSVVGSQLKMPISINSTEQPSVSHVISEGDGSIGSESRKKKKKERQSEETSTVMDVTPFRKPADLEALRGQRIMSDVQESDSSSSSIKKKKKKDKRSSEVETQSNQVQGDSLIQHVLKEMTKSGISQNVSGSFTEESIAQVVDIVKSRLLLANPSPLFMSTPIPSGSGRKSAETSKTTEEKHESDSKVVMEKQLAQNTQTKEVLQTPKLSKKEKKKLKKMDPPVIEENLIFKTQDANTSEGKAKKKKKLKEVTDPTPKEENLVPKTQEQTMTEGKAKNKKLKEVTTELYTAKTDAVPTSSTDVSLVTSKKKKKSKVANVPSKEVQKPEEIRKTEVNKSGVKKKKKDEQKSETGTSAVVKTNKKMKVVSASGSKTNSVEVKVNKKKRKKVEIPSKVSALIAEMTQKEEKSETGTSAAVKTDKKMKVVSASGSKTTAEVKVNKKKKVEIHSKVSALIAEMIQKEELGMK